MSVKEGNLNINLKSPLFYFIAILLFILILAFTTKQYWGTDTIGSIFAKNSFETSYYVNVYEYSNDVKSYRFKADIKVQNVNGKKYVLLDKIHLPYAGYFSTDSTSYKDVDNDKNEDLSYEESGEWDTSAFEGQPYWKDEKEKKDKEASQSAKPKLPYLTFEDSGLRSLKFNEKVRFLDDTGHEWYIELTKDKVN